MHSRATTREVLTSIIANRGVRSSRARYNYLYHLYLCTRHTKPHCYRPYRAAISFLSFLPSLRRISFYLYLFESLGGQVLGWLENRDDETRS